MQYKTFVPENISQNKHVELILRRIRQRLAPRGVKSLIGLNRQFKAMDLKNDGMVTLRDFIRSLKDYHIEITEQDIHLLMVAFAKKGSEGINYNDFMKSLLGTMNESRQKLVNSVFANLDKDKDGIIDVPSPLLSSFPI